MEEKKKRGFTISELLQISIAHDLEAEVVETALKYTRDEPSLSSLDALRNAMVDWDVLTLEETKDSIDENLLCPE